MSNKNYNSNRSNGKKRGFKNLLRWIALALVSATLAAVMVFAFGGLKFENPFNKDVNPDNLLKYDDYDKDAMLEETGYGLTVKWKEDGSLRMNGKNADPAVDENQVKEYTFTSLTLEPGTYTLDSGYKNGQLNTLGVFATVNGQTYYAASSAKTFTVDETSTVSIGFYVCNDKTFVNTALYPTLVKGESAGSFYVD